MTSSTSAKNKIVLIFTISEDPHVDSSLPFFKKLGYKVVRIDTDKISKTSQVKFKTKPSAVFGIVYKNKNYLLKDIHSIWFRKPFLRFENKIGVNNKDLLIKDFKFDEFRNVCLPFILEALKLNIFVLCYHDRYVIPQSKLLQLSAAQSIGFNIPDTLVSSDFDEISRFIKKLGGYGIFKKLGKPKAETVNDEVFFSTYLFSYNEFKNYYGEKVIDHPIFVQQKIEKREELRITIVGKKVFACSINTQDFDDSKISSKLIDQEKLTYKLIDLPKEVEEKCINICKYFDLQFGTIDMAITPEGKYVFFEINPNGQYLWIEDKTKAPISEAIANLLVNPKDYSIS